jgi:hypothetical protein
MHHAQCPCTARILLPSYRSMHGTSPQLCAMRPQPYNTTGIDPEKLTAQSLRLGGATALLCAQIDRDTIKLIGRWKLDAMLRYLHAQAVPAMNTLAPCSNMASLPFNHSTTNPIKLLVFYKKLLHSLHNSHYTASKYCAPKHSEFPTLAFATLQPTIWPMALWENHTIGSHSDGIWRRQLVNCLYTPHVIQRSDGMSRQSGFSHCSQ